MPKRLVSACSPDHECSWEEIDAIIAEHHAVREDVSIRVYVNPSAEDLVEVIAAAEVYVGEWYHSRVVLPDEFKDVDVALKQRVLDLGAEAGIVIEFSFESPELEKVMMEGFADSRSVWAEDMPVFGPDTIVLEGKEAKDMITEMLK